MDAEAVVRRAPELALIDELAHTNAPGRATRSATRTSRRCSTPASTSISTVNIQHLESLNDAVFELTGVRVRETFPDRMLDEADEVVLVDLTPEELQERLRAGKVYPHEPGRGGARRTSSGPRTCRRCASSRCARWPRTSRPGGRPRVLDPLSPQAVLERILVLVEPQPQLAAADAPGLALGPAARRRRRRALGAPPGARADRGRAGRAGRPAPAGRSCSAPTSSRRRTTISSRRCAAIVDRPRHDLRLPRHARRAPARRDRCAARSCSRMVARAARGRHPRRRRPRPATGARP